MDKLLLTEISLTDEELDLVIRASSLSALPNDTQERHLLSAILERALLDALLEPSCAEYKRWRADARAWFSSNLEGALKAGLGFSFFDIAKELDVPICKIRKFLEEHASWRDWVRANKEKLGDNRRCIKEVRPRMRRVSHYY